MPRQMMTGTAPVPSDVMVEENLDPLLTSLVSAELGDRQPLRILDAGCGRMWTWDLGGLDYELTGVDEDSDAIELRLAERADLDAWIVSDLRTVELEPASYDLVHSAYVLEHVRGAELVLDRMLVALRPGGLMVIRIPDGHSVYGALTHHSPHVLHVWYKRYVRRKPLAGTPGHGPYRTVYDRVVSLSGMTGWALANGLEIVSLYGDNSHLRFFGGLRPAVDWGLHLIARMSFGKLTARYSNLVLVLRKPPVASP